MIELPCATEFVMSVEGVEMCAIDNQTIQGTSERPAYSPLGHYTPNFTDKAISLSSPSRKVPSDSRCLRKLQSVMEPVLILRLSNLILSKCGALVSIKETTPNQEIWASED